MKRAIMAVAVITILAGMAMAQSRFFYQQAVTVNPYEPVTVTDGNVKSLYVYAPDVNYKMSLNTDNYTVMEKGGAMNFAPIQLETMTLKLQGDTATDTGTVYIIYTK